MEIFVNADGVVFDIVKSIGKAIDKKDCKNLDYSDWIIHNQDNDVISDIVKENIFWKNLQPFEDAWHQLNHWFEIGNSIKTISTRQEEAHQKILEKSLDEWRIPSALPIHTPFSQKYNFLTKDHRENCLFIDDNPLAVSWLIKNDFNAVMRRAWYNQDSWDTLPNIGTLYEITI